MSYAEAAEFDAWRRAKVPSAPVEAAPLTQTEHEVMGRALRRSVITVAGAAVDFASPTYQRLNATTPPQAEPSPSTDIAPAGRVLRAMVGPNVHTMFLGWAASGVGLPVGSYSLYADEDITRLTAELADEKAVVDVLRSELQDRLQKQRAAEAELQEACGLSVWYGQMPETNGKSNFTAILHRGDMASGHTIARSEYPDQVRYHADCVRWLIGELKDRPFILDYDEKLHSGYVAAAPEATNGRPE
jgi:hypothetical protein